MVSLERRSTRRRRPVPAKYFDSSESEPEEGNPAGSTAEATAAPPEKVTAVAAAAAPPPPLSPADIEQFAQSLKAYVIGWVSCRLAAAAADAADANDDGDRSGGDALLASLADDFPFLGAALRDRDPARLKALAAAGIPGGDSRRAHIGGSSGASTAPASRIGNAMGRTGGDEAAAVPDSTVCGRSSTSAGGKPRKKRAQEGGGDGGDRMSTPRPPPRQRSSKSTKRRRRVGADNGDEEYDPSEDGDEEESDDPTEKRGSNAASWTEKISKCRSFKEEHGHLNIPTGHPVLGKWAKYMRDVWYKSLAEEGGIGASVPDRTREKLRELEELGFRFERQRRQRQTWQERLEQCRKYKEENGHLDISQKHPELGRWARKMRELRKNAGMTEVSEEEKDKLRQLKELGFSFRNKSRFEDKLAQLAEYKEKHGPGAFPLLTDPVLGKWVESVRREYTRMGRGEKSTYLTVERMRQLTEAGFVFRGSKPTVSWEERLEQLRKFKEENGHMRVSRKEELGRWAQRQRQQYYKRVQDGKHSALTPERQKKLDDLGFVFELGQRNRPEDFAGPHKTWDERFEEFKKFLAEHGHPYVPQVGDRSNEVRGLGRWVAKQRQKYKYMMEGGKYGHYGAPLAAEKALKLANAGFAWDASHIHKTPKSSSKPLDSADSSDEVDHEPLDSVD